MKQIEDLLALWQKDSVIDRTEPGKELINIPQLHSKYLNILSRHRLLSKEAEFKYNKMLVIKRSYYTGKLSKEDLDKYGWDQFELTLIRQDVDTYLEGDDDLNKYKATKIMHDEIVDLCQSILKELNARTFQLRDFISWEKFIHGS